MQLLSLNNISAGYAGRGVLHTVSLSIEKGDFVGIVGANGSGKSTLLRVMTGLISPTSGEVIFEGRPLSALSHIDKAGRFGTAFLHKDSLPSFTVREYLEQRLFARRSLSAGEGQDIVREQMEVAEIDSLAGRNIRTLSAGELQRASIAAALVQSREILFLDQPTAHLDIRHILSTESLLKKLHRSGTTIIAVFHDINLAVSLSTVIAGIAEGKLACSCSPECFIQEKKADQIFGVQSCRTENPYTGKPVLHFTGSEFRDGSL